MSSVIQETLLERHSAGVLPELSSIVENNYALLKVKVSECSILQSPIFFHFMIDRSGSMSDKCKDGMSKMAHTIHTLTNMMRFFAKNEDATIYVQVCAFDDIVEEIIGTIQVTKKGLGEIIEKLESIYARDSTNIERALLNSSSRIDEYAQDHPTHRISHIFMTDGDATAGSSDVNYLKTLIDPKISNTFVAFGIQHNAKMLNEFGKISPKSSNWLIEKLENAGLVYGEIINNELYIAADNASITVCNGLIYDYITNRFVEKLDINTLIAETEKSYHISTSNPNECYAVIRGTNVSSGEAFEEIVPMLPDLLNENEEIIQHDLIKHMFRLRSQQLMHEILSQRQEVIQIRGTPHLRRQNANYTGFNLTVNTNFNDDSQYDSDDTLNSNASTVIPTHANLSGDVTTPQKTVKQEILRFQNEILSYIKDHDLQEDPFMQTICDDIFVTLQTMNSSNQYMYVSARQASQGRQQTYNVVDIEFNDQYEDSDDLFNDSIPRVALSRSHTNYINTTPTMMRTMTDISQHISRSPSPM
jgi:hypothetical protein